MIMAAWHVGQAELSDKLSGTCVSKTCALFFVAVFCEKSMICHSSSNS